MANRQNKFARQAEERKARQKNKGIERDRQPTVDEHLVRLEDDIRRLKVEFDIFFNGASKRAPYDTKSRVETVIKRLADERTLTYAQRYLYNTLVARFTAFRELWRRTMQNREEGRDAVTIARAAAHVVEANAAQVEPSTFVCTDAHTDVPTVKHLYDTLLDAKKRCGEPVEDFSFSRFHRMIAAKTDALKERLGCERVRFFVDVQDGRVSFKAKADT